MSKGLSIKRQLFVMTVLVLCVINGIAIWGANLYAERAAKLSFDRLLHGAALQIAESINLLDGRVVIDLPVSAFETLALAPSDRAYYAVTRLDTKEVLTGYDNLPSRFIFPQSVSADLGAEAPMYMEAPFYGEATRFIRVVKRLIEADQMVDVEIVIGQTTVARLQLADEMGGMVIRFLISFFVVTLALLMFGIWRVLRPLKLLKKAIEARSSTELTPLNTAVPTEIQPLIEAMNFFMAQLANTLERLKRFTGEAAHQLRTPLAGLNLQAQNALDEPDPIARKRQLNDIIESSALLSETVNHLLNEATLAHRMQSEVFRSLNLHTLVQDVCRSLVVWALQRDVEIAYLGNAEHKIRGDDVALTQMLRNLIENAVKYSPEGSSVEINLTESSAGLILTVSDQGSGIRDKDKQHVFERFYRGQHNQTMGSGIGLSIAKEVAEHHKAVLTLEDNHPTGLIIKVTFPQEATV
ncbi:sensor histidine kinase [Marinomonas piezotolerans]|uniref:histidine kinase n=1 Tax=Marinomonas piezotolerans TaxID=2213058 RepID=A0A370UEF9_9GAMM|nr:sensor histidine kinase [Marinomonas piezotolerans]RDL46177.1 sensor histidine kinase [Marinomonas piezotolerans]